MSAVIKGLKSRAELNGKTCSVLGAAKADGRVPVRVVGVDGKNVDIAVRAENLEELSMPTVPSSNNDTIGASLLDGLAAQLGTADIDTLAASMASMKQLLPAAAQRQADKLLSDPTAFKTALKSMKPPTATEAAYAGTGGSALSPQQLLLARSSTPPPQQQPKQPPPPLRSPLRSSSAAGEAAGEVGEVGEVASEARRRVAAMLQASRRKILAAEDAARASRQAASSALRQLVPGAAIDTMATLDGRLLVSIDGAFDEADVEE